ncbi:MAG: hypothetical protein Q4B28_00980 [bacterium]|nr:hypothetical protein [bacterium]
MKNQYQQFLKWGGLFVLSFGVIFGAVFVLSQSPQEQHEKPELPLQTTPLAQLTEPLSISKAGKVVANQDILVTAQANGRISRIAYQEGQAVKGGAQVVFLADTISQYALQTQRAKNSLDRSLLMKKEAEATLGQQLLQTENAYRSAESAFELAQSTTQNTIKQAELGLSSAQSQITALKEQFQGQKLALLGVMTALIEAADKWLMVTDFYQDQQQAYRVYLGAKDPSYTNAAKVQLRTLYTQREKVKNLPSIPQDDQELKESTQFLEQSYREIESFAGVMVEVMRKSIASEGTLSQATIDANIQTFQSFQVGQALLAPKSSFIAYANQVNAQLL